jgi:hypothetical protein
MGVLRLSLFAFGSVDSAEAVKVGSQSAASAFMDLLRHNKDARHRHTTQRALLV